MFEAVDDEIFEGEEDGFDEEVIRVVKEVADSTDGGVVDNLGKY